MNYITSVTSDSNNMIFSNGTIGTETDRVSATSPINAQQNTQQGGFWPFSSSHSNIVALINKAILEHNTHAVTFLIKNADCIKGKINGRTILHQLMHNLTVLPQGSNALAVLLARSDISKIINEQEDGTLNTALHIAAANGNQEACTQLVRAGANPSIKNNEGSYIGSDSESTPVNKSPKGVQSVDCNSLSSFDSDTEAIKNLSKIFFDVRTKPSHLSDASYMPDSLEISPTSQTIQYTTKHSKQYGGGLFDTEQYVEKLLSQYDNSGAQYGGSKTIMGVRQMRTMSDFDLSGGMSDDSESNDSELSRLVNNQAQEIHERTIKKIIDLMKVDEHVARNYKAALYKKIKVDHPELNNLDRATEMEKLATKSVLKGINIDQVTKEIEEHIASRKSSESPLEKVSKQKHNKKDNKKALSGTSAASVPSESGLSDTSTLASFS